MNVTFENLKTIAVLSKENSSEKRLSIIRWNDGDVVFDLRRWDAKTNRPLKGVTIRADEMRALIAAVSEAQIEEVEKMNDDN